MCCKMIEYHTWDAAPEEQHLTSPQGAGTNLAPYMTLAVKCGLTDDDMDIGNSGVNEQTVEQEYQAYIMAPLSPKMTDIIKF